MARSSSRKNEVVNAVIGQSGGPTAVINQSLVGAILEARRHKCIGRFYGSLHGIKGLMRDTLVDLSRENQRTLEEVADTPGAALGSVRLKPTEDDCRAALETMRRRNIGYFFYIGGNDSAEAALILERLARREKYPLHLFHIPKTIDNDLRGSDHCPGYASAARFVAQAFMGFDLDNRALPGVHINIVMGRNAGFLTAASVLGRVREDSGPHLIYTPERNLSEEQFVGDIAECVQRYGRCVVAVSEGLRDQNGHPLAERLLTEVDSFGNRQFSGSGALGDFLCESMKRGLKGVRVRADTLGYMQRSFMGVVSEVDQREARQVGTLAVRLAAQGAPNGSISILRENGTRYRARYERSPLTRVARVTREMPSSFINRAGNNITPAFEEYARPLVGKLPKPGFLRAKLVEPMEAAEAVS